MFISKKNPEWAIKTEFQHYLVCFLFHTRPGCCHQGHLKFPLCVLFFFSGKMAKIHRLTAAYVLAKVFMVPVQIKSPNVSEKSFLPAAAAGAEPCCAPSQQPFQAFEPFLGWEFPTKEGVNYFGGLCTSTAICYNGSFTAILQEGIIRLMICWFS